MKSVGEVMAIGRTFQESVQKALRGLEVGSTGLEHMWIVDGSPGGAREELVAELTNPGADRIWYLADAFRAGMDVDEVFRYSGVDPWFLVQIEDLVETENSLKTGVPGGYRRTTPCSASSARAFADARLAVLLNGSEARCAPTARAWVSVPFTNGWIPAPRSSPPPPAYMYSTYEEECEAAALVTATRSWCWGAAPTGSARASSSTTAACTRRWPCARMATRPSWSTATRRPSPPITTPRIACTSSR